MRSFTLAAATAAALLSAPQAQAVAIAVNEADGEVTLTGTLDWTQIDGGTGSFGSGSYVVRIPLAGSPFEAGFTPPAADAPVVLSATGTLFIEAPLFQPFGDQAYSGLASAFGSTSAAATPPLSQTVLRMQDVTRTFPQGSLDGDFTYQFIFNFDAVYGSISSAVALLRVRTPLIQTDFFDTDVYMGLDQVSATVPGATATPEVPLPASVMLLAGGLLGLGGIRRARKG